MTPEQIAGQADVIIQLERETERLVREQRDLYAASLATDLNSPETTRWINRGEQINQQLDRLADARIMIYGSLTADESRAVSRIVATAIPDQWYHVPNALPPEER